LSSALRLAALWLVLIFAVGLGRGVSAAEPTPAELDGITVNEHLGDAVDPELSFTDHRGETVRIGDYWGDGKPVLLTLNYYTCGTICGVQLSAVLEGLQGLDMTLGEDFRVVTVSIDPRESADVAGQKRDAYAAALGAGADMDWHFLVGDEANIAALADTVGFVYRYDKRSDQYAHPAVITLLSPEGAVARYLYGLQYPPRDLRFGLLEAAEGRVGSPVDKLILSCFRWDVSSGRYTPFAFGFMRIGGILSMVFMVGLGLVLWRRDGHQEEPQTSRAADDPSSDDSGSPPT